MSHSQTDVSTNRGPVIAFAILALIWGYNWVVMKIAMQYCPPMLFALLRVGGGAAVILTIVAFSGAPLKLRHPWKTVLLGLLQTSGFVGLISWSVAMGSAGKSAVFAYTMPFWVIILSWPLLGEQIRRWQWLAVVLALAGLVLTVQPWNTGAAFRNNLLGLTAGFCWAASVIVVKKIPIGNRMEMLTVTGWQMVFGLPLIMLAAFILPEPAITWNATFIIAVLYNILAGTVIAWLLWYYVLQKLSANASGLSALVVPVVGVLAAWIQLGEQPGIFEGTGMILILAALALLALHSRYSKSNKKGREATKSGGINSE